MESIDDFYKRDQKDFHNYLQQVTGSTGARVSSLYEEVLAYAKYHKDIFENINLKDIKPSDHNTVRNRLRYLALRLDITAQRFHMLSVQEQHRFCERLKERFSKTVATTQYEGIVKRARKELMHLVHKEPECTDESILQWIHKYVENELLIHGFTEMWEKLKPWLKSIAKSKTKTPEEAEDLFQQTYYHAIRYIRTNDRIPEEGKMKAWLRIIMQNAFLDDVREISHIYIEPLNEQAEHLLDEEDIEKTVIDEQGKKELDEILQTLSPEVREVMRLYLLHDMPLSEIAVVLDVKLETVRARFKRARPKLLAKLSAKSFAEYLNHSPKAQFKLQSLLKNYTPTKIPKGLNIADTNIETQSQYEIIVRSMLSLHIEGYDSREIAEMLTFENTDATAFAKRIAAIKTCLEENLLRLFTSFYEKNGNQD